MKRFKSKIPVFISIISLILSGIQGVSRLRVEQSKKDVQLLVAYNDIKKASEIYGKSFEEILISLKELGVGGVLVKEQTIKSETRGNMASWEEQGRVSVFTGSELMLLETMAGMDSDKINPVHYYLWIPDEKIRNNIQKHNEYKLGEANLVEINNQLFLDAGYSANDIFVLGTGYPMEDLEIIASQDYLSLLR